MKEGTFTFSTVSLRRVIEQGIILIFQTFAFKRFMSIVLGHRVQTPATLACPLADTQIPGCCLGFESDAMTSTVYPTPLSTHSLLLLGCGSVFSAPLGNYARRIAKKSTNSLSCQSVTF